MGDREELHDKLVAICEHAYYQAPSNVSLKYPCVVYVKADIETTHANNGIYNKNTMYNLTVMERDPDHTIGENVLDAFSMCSLNTMYVADNVNHTSLSLYY